MDNVLLSLISRLKFKIRFNSVVYISGERNCFDILNDVAQFKAPYQNKMALLDNEPRFFGGFASSSTPDIDYNQIISKDDLTTYIPELVEKATTDYMGASENNLNWPDLANHINRNIFEQYFGLPLSDELIRDCKILYDGLLLTESKNSAEVSLNEQQALATAYSALKSAIQDAFDHCVLQEESSIANLVKRLLILKKTSNLSDDVIVDILTGLILSVCPLMERSFAEYFAVLRSDKKITSLLHQAASAGDVTALTKSIQKLNPLTADPLIRVAVSDTSLPRLFLANLNLKPGEKVVLLTKLEKIEKVGVPESLASSAETPAANFLQHGFEPHITFGKTIISNVIAESLIAVFSTRRIKHISGYDLRLEKLPEDANEYYFQIYGSSPAWSVGEEQSWILDTYGVKKHIQYNILSIYEFARILIKRNLEFYATNAFYAAYDKKHQILMSSSYGAEADEAIIMGNQFHTFASALGVKRIKPASHFSKNEFFQESFQAYTVLRNNYYTLAYFSAFLDKGYGFMLKAMLIFNRKQIFIKPLTIVGDLVFASVIGLVAILMEVPLIKKQLRDYFAKTVEENLANIRQGIDILDNILADGRPYIFGEEFCAADIHICATMANLVVPDEFHRGGYVLPLDRYPPAYRSYIEEFRRTPAGQYALRVYRQHRN